MVLPRPLAGLYNGAYYNPNSLTVKTKHPPLRQLVLTRLVCRNDGPPTDALHLR